MPQDWRISHLGLFPLLAIVLTLGILAQDYWFGRSLAREQAALSAVTREIGLLQVALADLRAAQAGYVATGQAPDVWMRRATEISATLEAGLTRLRESSANEDVRARIDAALATVANLSSLDKRSRDHIAEDQRFLAADLVFVDSLELNQRLGGDLDSLGVAEASAAEARMAVLSWLPLAIDAVGIGAVLLLGLGSGQRVRPPAASEAATMAQMLRELPPPVKPAAPVARTTVAPLPPLPPPPPPPPATPVVSLSDAAELCVNLARVIDSRDVPALLDRAARLLDAKGVILWVADAAGLTLRPSLTHGYPEKVLMRLGALDVSADNMTSLAFRSMQPQVAPGAGSGAAGAIAVPLITSAGCSGVLAAELRDVKAAPDLVAVTRILAAQFSTIVAPTDVGAERAAEA